MIPILYDGETVIGFLAEAVSCVVTEERNGIFELSLSYPVTGALFPELQVDRIIKAKPNDTSDLQLFRIYTVEKPISGAVTVSAEHISYALSAYPVSNISIRGTATQAISALLTAANQNLETPHAFSVGTTDMTAVRDFACRVGTVRSALGGTEGSVLDVFGGEYEFDNYVVKLHTHRGTDTGIRIAYGKNLTDLKCTTSLENSYTALMPYALKDDVLTLLPEHILSVQNNSGIAERVLVRDFTSYFEQDEEINATTLRAKANAYLSENNINAPAVNLTVSFIHLWQSPEYAGMAALEKVSLCDYVTVYHSVLGVDVKAQVIKTVYDCIAERYEKLELGTAQANFGDTLRQAVRTAEEAKRLARNSDMSAVTQAYLSAIDSATKAITGNSGGCVVLNPALHPQELLIMNTADVSTATKVWRWNSSGLGYSSHGYSGPYSTAITSNGAIVADFITAGTLTANIIKAGVLTSANGASSFNLESGLLTSSNINVTGGTIKIGGNDYYTKISDGSIEQHYGTYDTLVGGLVPTRSSGALYETLYCGSNADGVSISRQDSSGSFYALAQFAGNGSYVVTDFSMHEDALVYGDFAVYGKVLGDLNFQSGCGVGLYCGGSSPSSAFRYYNGKVALGVEGKELLLYASAFSAANPIDLGSSSNRWGRLYLSSVLDCYSIDATSIRCTSVNTQGNAITSGDIVPVSD